MDFKKKINGLVSDLDESTQYESVDFIEDLDNKELDEIWVLWEVYLRKIGSILNGLYYLRLFYYHLLYLLIFQRWISSIE